MKFTIVIGVSSAQLLYDNAIDLDRGIFLSLDAVSGRNNLSKFTQEILSTQNRFLHEASKRQQAKRFAHLNNNKNGDKPITKFSINSFVLVSYPDNPVTGKR